MRRLSSRCTRIDKIHASHDNKAQVDHSLDKQWDQQLGCVYVGPCTTTPPYILGFEIKCLKRIIFLKTIYFTDFANDFSWGKKIS